MLLKIRIVQVFMIISKISPIFFVLATLLELLSPAYAQQPPSEQTVDCARSIPTPIVKKSVFPNTRFVLNKLNENGLTIAEGIETIRLKNGDQLIITQSGCESVTINFRFQTSLMSGKRTDARYLYQQSARLMRQISPGVKSPVYLQRGILALEKAATQKTPPAIDREIDYGNRDIRSVFKLSPGQQLANKKRVVEILFYYGPL
jgi:hypothetical protein